MGNRAIITTAPASDDNIGIYVHWNGGQESVEGFLMAARDLGIRCPKNDPSYALARLTQIIGMYFGGTLSLGIGKVSELDPGDNGIWQIGEGWRLSQAQVEYAAKVRRSFDRQKAEAIRADIVAKFEANEPQPLAA